MSDCKHGGRDVYERPKCCGDCANFGADPDMATQKYCEKIDRHIYSNMPVRPGCGCYGDHFEPRVDHECLDSPCDTLKRQAMRIRELMDEKEQLEALINEQAQKLVQRGDALTDLERLAKDMWIEFGGIRLLLKYSPETDFEKLLDEMTIGYNAKLAECGVEV